MMALADARRSAAVYLKASLGLVQNPSVYALMCEMAANYEQMDILLSSYYSSMPLPAVLEAHASPKQLWNLESRRRQAELLDTVAGLDQRGDELAVMILEQAQAR